MKDIPAIAVVVRNGTVIAAYSNAALVTVEVVDADARDMTDEEIIEEIHDICMHDSPYDVLM